MNFMDAVRRKKRKIAGVLPVDIPQSESEPELVSELTEADIPADMPLTNNLDKMTKKQAVWAIRNGGAWLAYLKSHDGEVYQHATVSDADVSDAEKYAKICSVLDKVWLEITEDRQKPLLDPENVQEWLETLEWADRVMPDQYESARKVIQSEIELYRHRRKL